MIESNGHEKNRLLKDLEKLLKSYGNVDLYIKVSDVLKVVEILKKK